MIHSDSFLHVSQVTHSYRPCIYILCKEGKTIASASFLFEAMNFVALQYFGAKVFPGCVGFDHSDAFLTAVNNVWPSSGWYTCWPHVARKVNDGWYLRIVRDTLATHGHYRITITIYARESRCCAGP